MKHIKNSRTTSNFFSQGHGRWAWNSPPNQANDSQANLFHAAESGGWMQNISLIIRPLGQRVIREN